MPTVTPQQFMEIALRGIAKVPWLQVKSTDPGLPKDGAGWSLTVPARVADYYSLDTRKIEAATTCVAWGWASALGVTDREFLYGGPKGASGQVQSWIRGKEDLTDEACMAIVLAALYGALGGGVLYDAEVADGNV